MAVAASASLCQSSGSCQNSVHWNWCSRWNYLICWFWYSCQRSSWSSPCSPSSRSWTRQVIGSSSLARHASFHRRFPCNRHVFLYKLYTCPTVPYMFTCANCTLDLPLSWSKINTGPIVTEVHTRLHATDSNRHLQ